MQAHRTHVHTYTTVQHRRRFRPVPTVQRQIDSRFHLGQGGGVESRLVRVWRFQDRVRRQNFINSARLLRRRRTQQHTSTATRRAINPLLHATRKSLDGPPGLDRFVGTASAGIGHGLGNGMTGENRCFWT